MSYDHRLMSIGVPRLDEDHGALMRQLDELGLAMKRGRGREAIPDILEFLERYTTNHFRTEEDLMQEQGYPEYLEHRTQHDRFRARLAVQGDRLARHPEERSLLLEFHGWALDWLRDHTISADGRLGDFLRDRGSPPETPREPDPASD